MLTEVEAIRFDRAMTTGKTKPILVACEKATGEEMEVVAKFTYGCNNSPEALVREAIAAVLAKDLGLPIPEPHIVSVTPEFISTIEDQEVVFYLKNSNPLGFGCRRLPDGYATWTPSSGKVPEHLLDSAADILAFDCFITNADRRIENPNLLCNGRSFAIIDHEMAFMTDLNMFWSPPWKAGALLGAYKPSNHVLYSSVKNGKKYNFARLIDAFSDITDNRINEYGQAIPTGWIGTERAIERAVNLIRELRDNIRPAIEELQRALS